MSQTIDLKVEYTNKLAQENEALRAQVELLRQIAFCPKSETPIKCIRDIQIAFRKTPAQCLAEIKAQAVEDAKKLCRHAFGSWEHVRHRAIGVADYELQEYANQIRQSAKGE